MARPAQGVCVDARGRPERLLELEAQCAEAFGSSWPDTGPKRVREVFAQARSGHRSVALWEDLQGEVGGLVAWEAVPGVGRRIVLWYLDPAHQDRGSLAGMLHAFDEQEPLRGPVFVAPDALPGLPLEDQAPVLETADMVHFGHVTLAFPAGSEVPGALLGRGWEMRPPTPEDHDALLELGCRAYREYPGQLWWPHVDLERDIAFYLEALRTGRHQVLAEGTFVLTLDGSVRGHVVTSRDDHGPYLDSIQVDPRVQGRGIGRALLVTALAGLRDAGVREDVALVYLRENARAGALYRSVGFVPATFSRPVDRGYWVRRRTLRAVIDRASTARFR